MFVNGESAGRQNRTTSSFRFRWNSVVYQPGDLIKRGNSGRLAIGLANDNIPFYEAKSCAFDVTSIIYKRKSRGLAFNRSSSLIVSCSYRELMLNTNATLKTSRTFLWSLLEVSENRRLL